MQDGPHRDDAPIKLVIFMKDSIPMLNYQRVVESWRAQSPFTPVTDGFSDPSAPVLAPCRLLFASIAVHKMTHLKCIEGSVAGHDVRDLRNRR
jgi:hypothetical protein